ATVLADMGIGAFAELEKPIAVAAALLVERAVVAVAFLMDDAEIVAAALGDAGDVADAVLPDRAAFDFVDQCIKTQTGLEHTVLIGIGGSQIDRELAGLGGRDRRSESD